jgi:hypothetical protein
MTVSFGDRALFMIFCHQHTARIVVGTEEEVGDRSQVEPQASGISLF